MINRNFKNIYENVGSNIQDTSSAMATIIKRMTNDVYFDLLRRINFEIHNYDYSFTATTQDNILPSDFGKEIAIYDNTNKLEITKTTQGKEVDNSLSTIASSGSSARYAIIDLPVMVQPSSAATPSFVSSDNLDNTQTIFIRGSIANNVEVTETLTLNGTTPVSATNSYIRYRTLSKSASTLGTVTGTHGSDTICVMTQESIDYKVKVLRLYPAPAQTIVVNLPYVISPLPLSSDYDTPLIDAADVIELGTTFRAWQYKRQFSKASAMRSLYEQGINNLIWERANQPNDSHTFNIGVYSRDNY